jgi:hypothetical protein
MILKTYVCTMRVLFSCRTEMTLFQVGQKANCRTSKFQRELEAIVIRIPLNITPETDLFIGK